MTEQQFSPLAERYMDTVFRVAYSYLRSPADADDVTQDVLLQLYKTDKAFDDDAHVKNWLIRVTVNRCKNVLRAPWHRTEDIADYENSLSFEEPQCHELFDAVMALDRRYRVPVLLDGVISAVAALAAARLHPLCRQAMVATHTSAEPAARLVLEELGLSAPIQAGLRLGEGSGAVCFLPLLDMALAVYGEMSTFDQIGLEPYQPLS